MDFLKIETAGKQALLDLVLCAALYFLPNKAALNRYKLVVVEKGIQIDEHIPVRN